jgi:hypothetical protein
LRRVSIAVRPASKVTIGGDATFYHECRWGTGSDDETNKAFFAPNTVSEASTTVRKATNKAFFAPNTVSEASTTVRQTTNKALFTPNTVSEVATTVRKATNKGFFAPNTVSKISTTVRKMAEKVSEMTKKAGNRPGLGETHEESPKENEW